MYWVAFRAIQLAADMAPKGARHSRNGPETRAARRRPLPLRLSAAAWAAWAVSTPNVDSQTVRKHSTWRQSPEATAMAAAMTEPPGPGRSPPPLIQVGWIRNASSIALAPPSLIPPPLIPG